MQLFEQYRPRDWSDVVGQDHVVRAIETLKQRGLAGRAYWLSGGSGTGKTTIAKLLAQQVADDWFIDDLDASELTVARLKEIEYAMGLTAPGKGGRAYIVNEAHGLRRDVIRQLLNILERLPRHTIMVFTTTSAGQSGLFGDQEDAGPLLSRCLTFELRMADIEGPFAQRVKWIAEQEGLGGASIDWFMQLAERHECNMRAMLQEVEAGKAIAGEAAQVDPSGEPIPTAELGMPSWTLSILPETVDESTLRRRFNGIGPKTMEQLGRKIRAHRAGKRTDSPVSA